MTTGESAGAGHDARWPLRAYPIARLLASGPHRREDLARLAETVCHVRKSLVEDVLCAMENDKIVEAAPVPHFTVAERRRALAGRLCMTAQERRAVSATSGALQLTANGRRFLFSHKQDLEAGTCICFWCADLAAIRAWAAETPLEEQRSILARVAASGTLG